MSDERVNVSKDLLDELSDSVQALTGTTENMSIEEMSAAVNAKANESFELIETIVLTEEVNVVERTKEPDGTDYNFKELYVEVSFPERYNMENNYSLGIVMANFGIGRYNPYFSNISILNKAGVDSSNKYNNQKQRICLYSRLERKMFLMRSGAGMDASAYSASNMGLGGNFGYTNMNSIKRFAIRTNNVFPVVAKPTIEIYGIRA